MDTDAVKLVAVKCDIAMDGNRDGKLEFENRGYWGQPLN
jgi:hypothetical protein